MEFSSSDFDGLDYNTNRIQEYLRQLSNNTPAQLYKKISKFGYIGQDKAKKAVSLLAFRHVNRLRKIYLEGIDKKLLPSKDNYPVSYTHLTLPTICSV